MLIFIEVLVVGLAIIWLYELKTRFGLAMLFFFIGSNQLVQVLLGSTVYTEIFGQYPVSLGSAVFFTSGLYAVMLLYLKEDIPTTRKFIYGLLFVNLSLLMLFVATRWGISSGQLQSMPGVPAGFWSFQVRAHTIGTLMLFIDVFLLIIIYETLRSRLAWIVLPVRVLLSLIIIVCLDTLVYYGIGFGGQSATAGIVTGNLIIKILTASAYGLILVGYLRFSELREPNTRPREMRDPFSIFTYRERIRALKAEKRELLAVKTRAEETDRLKSSFLATMSHELRTPLNSIIGFTGVVEQGLAGPLNDEQKKQLQMAQVSAGHLLELINDVLDISRIEAGQLEIQPGTFEMRAAIEKVVEELTPMAQAKGLLLEVEATAGTVTSDRRRVEQILINLVNNAIKFTETGKIRIESTLAQDRLVTRVVDTGIGIRPENIDLLFTPFQQVETGLARNHEGSGLGLSICKKLAEALGGEISAASEWGAGSVFTFTLPIGQREAS